MKFIHLHLLMHILNLIFFSAMIFVFFSCIGLSKSPRYKRKDSTESGGFALSVNTFIKFWLNSASPDCFRWPKSRLNTIIFVFLMKNLSKLIVSGINITHGFYVLQSHYRLHWIGQLHTYCHHQEYQSEFHAYYSWFHPNWLPGHHFFLNCYEIYKI